MSDIAEFAGETVGVLDTTLKDVRIPRANLGPCPVCGNDIVENRKGYSCWSREDPGCGFVIWKAKAGKQLPRRGRPRADRHRAHGAAGDRLQGPQRPLVPRPPRARADADDGKWRVEFDEPWASEGAKPPEAEEPAEGTAAAADTSPAAAA